MRRAFLALVVVLSGIVVAASCDENGATCPCESYKTGPGWCEAEVWYGNECTCQTTTVCPGWCQPNDDPNAEPVQCADSGSPEPDSGMEESGTKPESGVKEGGSMESGAEASSDSPSEASPAESGAD